MNIVEKNRKIFQILFVRIVDGCEKDDRAGGTVVMLHLYLYSGCCSFFGCFAFIFQHANSTNAGSNFLSFIGHTCAGRQDENFEMRLGTTKSAKLVFSPASRKQHFSPKHTMPTILLRRLKTLESGRRASGNLASIQCH